jgi:rhodanese-related sulfurtransferase
MVADIDPEELAAFLRDGHGGEDGDGSGNGGEDGDGRWDPPTIVDIRSRRAFDRGHIPGSRNIPFPELTTRVAELEGADRIVTVCPHGVSSRQAAALIESYAGTADARVENLRGGLDAWEGPLEPTTEASSTSSGGDEAVPDDEGPEAPF